MNKLAALLVVMFAATATPGQPNTATSAAASHKRFRVPSMIRSLVIVHLSPSWSQTPPS